MPTPALDLTKSPEEILMDEINFKNNTNLLYSKFVFSTPTPATLAGENVNTMVTLVPVAATGYYGSKDIYYKRIDLAQALAAPTGMINPANFTMLSDLIPQINTTFGIVLKSSDYVDVPLPVYSSLDSVVTPTVLITAPASSLLFTGSYNLPLGPVLPAAPADGESYAYYIWVSGYPLFDSTGFSNHAKMITSVMADGSPNYGFTFLKNVVGVITQLDIQEVFSTNDGRLILNGNFNFKATLSNNLPGETTIIQGQSLVFDLQGAVVSFGANRLFNEVAGQQYAETKPFALNKTKYCTATQTEANSFGVYKYSDTGIEDTSFDISFFTNIPSILSVCDDGKLYVVSDRVAGPDGTPVKYIDRLNENGTIDNSFNRVTFGSVNGLELLPIVQLLPITGNGFAILIDPLYGTSVNSVLPTINGTPLAPQGQSSNYAWNPILRFSQNGTLDPLFKSELKNNLDRSIYWENQTTLEDTINPIIYNSDVIGFMTFKQNQITGFGHNQPITFDKFGNLELLDGKIYSEQYHWYDVWNVINQPNGSFVAYGTMLEKLPTGGWATAVINCLATYNSNSSVNKLIFRAPKFDIDSNELTMAKAMLQILPATV